MGPNLIPHKKAFLCNNILSIGGQVSEYSQKSQAQVSAIEKGTEANF